MLIRKTIVKYMDIAWKLYAQMEEGNLIKNMTMENIRIQKQRIQMTLKPNQRIMSI